MRTLRATFTLVTVLLCGMGGRAVAERDLGVQPFDGSVDLVWTAVEATGSGHWTGSYRMQGSLADAEEGEEAFLAGWSFRCEGEMSGTAGHVERDRGDCTFEGSGNRFTAHYSGGPGPWQRSVLRIAVFGGSGVYRRVQGEGAVERVMHLPLDAPTGWGFLAGRLVWHRDPSGGD